MVKDIKVYKVSVDNEYSHQDDLLIQEKFFKSVDNAEAFRKSVLQEILEKYELSSDEEYENYSLKKPYENKPMYEWEKNILSKNEMIVKFSIENSCGKSEYDTRVFIQLEEIKLED